MLERLQEELLNLGPLVKHDLGEGSDVLEFAVLVAEILLEIHDVLFLLLNNLLMLKLQQLLLLLKVIHNLLQRLLKDHDLFFQILDFLCLVESSLFVLLLGTILNHNIAAHLLIVGLQSVLFALVVLQRIPLTHSLLCQLLILIVNATLNLLDVSLGVLLGLELEVVELGLEFGIFLLLHSRLLNLNPISLLLYRLFQASAILPPSHELQLILELLPLRAAHFLELVGQFALLDHGIIDLLLVGVIYLLHFALVELDRFGLLLLVVTFEGLDFVFEEDHLLHRLVIILRQLQYDVLLLLVLLLQLALQLSYILGDF